MDSERQLGHTMDAAINDAEEDASFIGLQNMEGVEESSLLQAVRRKRSLLLAP